MKIGIKALHIFILTMAIRFTDRHMVTFFVLTKHLVAFFHFKKEL